MAPIFLSDGNTLYTNYSGLQVMFEISHFILSKYGWYWIGNKQILSYFCEEWNISWSYRLDLVNLDAKLLLYSVKIK